LARAQQASRRALPVLVTGETGTGKDFLARWIHSHSSNHLEPYIAVDCTAIVPEIVDCYLFGHTRPGFDNLVPSRIGVFGLVGKGTLLLENAEALSSPVCQSIARTLRTRAYTQVGPPTEPLPWAGRLVLSSTQDLGSRAAASEAPGHVLPLLFEAHIRIPAIRDRIEDVPEFIERFIWNRTDPQTVPPILSAAGMRQLIEYDWPGNITEIEEAVVAAMALLDGSLSNVTQSPLMTVTLANLIAEARAVHDHDTFLQSLNRHVFQALRRNGLAEAVFGSRELRPRRTEEWAPHPHALNGHR